MKTFRTTIIAMLLMTMGTATVAQDKVETTVSADLVSRYIWRGMELGKAAVQPTLGVAYKGISLSAWGSYGIMEADDTDELDLTLSYSISGLTVGVTDYWFSGGDNKYFVYSADKTAHVYEAFLGYDFGVLSATWYTNFAGADGVNKDGNRAYSSYLELAAPFKLGGLDWTATVGAVPFASSYYEDATGFAVTNVTLGASKDVKITDSFSLPVFASLTANPSTQKMFFTLGVTIE